MSAKKFEKMIECIVNDDEARAKEIFHDIIVEKSRQIYESMMSEDQTGEFMDEIESEENGSMMEDDFETDEEIGGDYEGEEEFGGEEGEFDDEEFDDEEGEFGEEEFGDEEGEGELEDRVVDLEDKLDQLMADFEAQMGDGGEEEFGDEEGEEEFGDEEGEEEFGDEEGDEEGDEDGLMENVKLTKVRGLYDSKIGGDDGVQTKSTVAANSGKRGMQGKPVNYDAGAEESQASGPKKPGSYVTKGQKEVDGAKSFKNVVGKNNFTAKGEATPKPSNSQTSGTNTRSAVPEGKRPVKRRI